MTSDRDIERLLDRWFTERPTQAADRVLDEVADRIARQHQRPGWHFHWRPFEMNTTIKIGAAIAAVLILAVAAWNLLPGSSTGVGGTTSSPSPPASAAPSPVASPSPAASPSAGAVFPQWFTPESDNSGAGILPAGSVTTQSFRPGFTFDVPEGWVNSGDTAGFYGLFQDTPANAAEHAASGRFAHEIFMGPHESPWFTCQAWEDNRGATAAEMATAVGANEALAVSGLVDVTIGGLTGKQLDVRLDPDWTDRCPGDPPTLDLGDQRTRGFLLDAPDGGVIVIFVGSLHSADHEAFVAEAMPIVESFQFDTGQ